MACGKSTLLHALEARVPGRTFIDLDAEIERATGKSIPQIFADHGQEYFRNTEQRILEKLSRTDAIIACGGGTPCRPGAMELMKKAGTVVWLKTDIHTTLRRLAQAPGQRPLVDNLLQSPAELKATVETMLAQRKPFYSQAHEIFDSTALETEEQIQITANSFIHQYL